MALSLRPLAVADVHRPEDREETTQEPAFARLRHKAWPGTPIRSPSGTNSSHHKPAPSAAASRMPTGGSHCKSLFVGDLAWRPSVTHTGSYHSLQTRAEAGRSSQGGAGGYKRCHQEKVFQPWWMLAASPHTGPRRASHWSAVCLTGLFMT